MKDITYTHSSGLVFNTSRMTAADGSDYDITLINLWLPNSAEEAMKIINWYCGEPDEALTKQYADEWCKQYADCGLQDFVKLQDRPTDDVKAHEPVTNADDNYARNLKELRSMLEAMCVLPCHDITITIDNYTPITLFDHAALVDGMINAIDYAISEL